MCIFLLCIGIVAIVKEEVIAKDEEIAASLLKPEAIRGRKSRRISLPSEMNLSIVTPPPGSIPIGHGQGREKKCIQFLKLLAFSSLLFLTQMTKFKKITSLSLKLRSLQK
jgi:hypothetical protein